MNEFIVTILLICKFTRLFVLLFTESVRYMIFLVFYIALEVTDMICKILEQNYPEA